jgi:molybdopterin/thiamine biosynthesis adenylyltransferase
MLNKYKQLDNLAQTRRYSRQIMLPAVDLAGQERLLNSKVLVVGLGGLGCAATPYLASAGVGQLTLVDGDTIDLSNLQRQILFTEADIGQNKANIAARQLLAQNPTIQIQAIAQFADAALLATLIDHHDLVLDCTDNLTVRLLINQACVRSKTALVSGAAIRFEGQLCCFANQGDGPCYQCLSTLFGEPQLSCLEAGIFAPVVGVIGVSQAMLALNILAGVGQVPWHQLQLLDGLTFDWRRFTLPRSADCPVCGGG